MTPTPRSTPLPPLPTPIPVGSTNNPLHLKIVAPQTTESLGRAQPAIDSAISDLEAAMLEATDLTVAVELVENDAEALAALCDSVSGTVSAAWLGGLAAMAADARACGSPALEVQRGTRSSATTGDEAVLVVATDSEITGAGDLSEKAFCRLGYTDPFTWLIPSLMLRVAGVMPDALASVTDYNDPAQMVRAVSDGTCDAAGMAASAFAALPASVRISVRTLDQSITIPYAVLVYPVQLPLGEQQKLTDALISIGNGSRAEVLAALVPQDQVLAISDSDLAGLRSFLNRAGVDLAQLGQ